MGGKFGIYVQMASQICINLAEKKGFEALEMRRNLGMKESFSCYAWLQLSRVRLEESTARVLVGSGTLHVAGAGSDGRLGLADVPELRAEDVGGLIVPHDIEDDVYVAHSYRANRELFDLIVDRIRSAKKSPAGEPAGEGPEER